MKMVRALVDSCDTLQNLTHSPNSTLGLLQGLLLSPCAWVEICLKEASAYHGLSRASAIMPTKLRCGKPLEFTKDSVATTDLPRRMTACKILRYQQHAHPSREEPPQRCHSKFFDKTPFTCKAVRLQKILEHSLHQRPRKLGTCRLKAWATFRQQRLEH